MWTACTVVDVGQQDSGQHVALAVNRAPRGASSPKTTGKLVRMPILRVHRRFTAWLAMLAVLWGCLLPVLSHAVAAHQAGDNGWVEVCTVTGMAWVKSDGAAQTTSTGSTQGDTGLGMNMANCDWCATHSPLTGLPAVSLPAVVPLVFGVDVPAAFLHAPRPLFVWATEQSGDTTAEI